MKVYLSGQTGRRLMRWFRRRSDHIIIDCPSCGAKRSASANTKIGAWYCFACNDWDDWGDDGERVLEPGPTSGAAV